MQKLIIGMMLIGSIANAQTAAKEQPLRSPELKRIICLDLSSKYAPEREDDNIETNNINVDLESCLKSMTATVKSQSNKTVGSKSYVVGIDARIQNNDLTCSVRADRSVTVTLDKNDKPIVKVSGWVTDSSLACYIKADPRMISIDERSPLVKRINGNDLPNNIYVPDAMELGEPDDGTVGWEYYSNVVKVGNKTIGYLLEYWYANSEGEWATKYILKYNERGMLLGNLITSEGAEYCDYPFFEADHQECFEE